MTKFRLGGNRAIFANPCISLPNHAAPRGIYRPFHGSPADAIAGVPIANLLSAIPKRSQLRRPAFQRHSAQ
jgi:hypothetical protein